MPILTAVGTAVAAAFFGGSALAAALITAGLTIAANYALSYLTRPKERAYSAVQGTVLLGARVPAGVVYGKSLVAGQRIYYAKYGSGNKWNAEVFVLSDGICEGLDGTVIFDGEVHDLVSIPTVGNETSRWTIAGYESYINFRFYDGSQTLPDSELVSATAGTATPWKSSSIVRNHAYVVIARKYNAKLFKQGRPTFKFALKGLKEYDPREASQDVNDPSTWEWTENPAIHRLNYLLGVRGLLSGNVRVGAGFSLSQIDVAAHINAANVCDATRDVTAGTIKTYACSLYTDAEDDHIQILAEFEDAMAGYGGRSNGRSTVIAGAPQIPSFAITKDDVRANASKAYQPKRSAFDTYNILSGQFTSIDSLWQAESLETISVSTDVVADGRKRETSNDFLQVTDPDIAQYLLNIRYRQNRKTASYKLPVSRRVGFQILEGQWVTYEGKTWLVTERAFNERIEFTITLSETGASIYDDASIPDGPVIVPSLPPNNPSLLSTIQDLTVEAGELEGVPHLKFTWTPPDDPSITDVALTYYVNGEVERFRINAPDPEAGEFYVSEGLISGKIYSAFASIVTMPDRFKTNTPIITAAVPITPTSVILNQLNSDITDVMQRLRDDLNYISSLTYEVAENTIEETANSYLNREVIFKRVGEAFASIAAESVARVDGDTALASSISSVSASVDDATAQGLFKLEALASPSGADVELGLFARAQVTDDFAQAGLVLRANLDNNGGASSAYLIGDQVAISDGNGGVVSLFNSDGQIVQGRLAAGSILADNIVTGTITADQIAINGLTNNSSVYIDESSYITTSSNSFIDMSGMSVDITTAANTKTLVMFGAYCSTGQAGGAAARLVVDGSVEPTTDFKAVVGGNTNVGGQFAIMTVLDLPAGTHTIKIQWRRQGGSGSRSVFGRSLIAYQFLR